MKYATIKKGKVEVYMGKGNPPLIQDNIEGQVLGLRVFEEEFNGNAYENLEISMNVNTETFKVKAKLDSGYGRAIINTLSNADLSQTVKIEPTYVEDTKKSGAFVSQRGAALKWKYTKKEPNGLPEMKQVIVNKKTIWDKTEQLDFYKKVVGELNAKAGAPEAPKKASVTETEDDLPF